MEIQAEKRYNPFHAGSARLRPGAQFVNSNPAGCEARPGILFKISTFVLLLICVICGQVSAQTAARYAITGSGAPSGSCVISGSGYSQIYINRSNGDWYTCTGTIGTTSGTWVLAGNHSAGTGSVTSVSVVTANGFSGSVATSTTTPAITINNPTALNATTSLQSPFFKSAASDPADAGAVRLGNNEFIEWEKATPGTDWTLGVNASDVLVTNAPFQALSFNKVTITQPASSATLTIPDGVTLNAGAGGTLGSNAFNSTAYMPLAGGTFTGDVTHSGAAIIISGNISAPAWTTSGVRIKGTPGTLTDTTSSGTVATAYTDVLGGNTIAASSAATFTNYFTQYNKDPIAGTNVTLTNKWALGADSAKFGTSNQVTISNAGVLTATSSLVTPVIGPTADGTTSIKFTKADLSTVVGVWDTTNTRLRIGSGVAPTVALDVTGTALISSTLGVTGIITASAQQTIGVGATSSALTDLLINPTTKASGNLIDAQVNSVSKFAVSFAGVVTAGSSSGGYQLTNGTSRIGGWSANNGGGIGGLGLNSSAIVGWTSTADGGNFGNLDTNISRNAAGIVQFGTTAANAFGSWTATNGTLSGTLSVTGASTQTGGTTIGTSGTAILRHLSATATLDFANLAAIGCEDLTITVTNAALGDTVAIGVPNGSVVANGTFTGWVSSAGTVSIRFCTVVSGDPASGTFRADVWQH